MDTDMLGTNDGVYEIPDGPPDASPAIPWFDYATMGKDGSVPLVIDNGSGMCRAGWASELDPRLEFDNLVAKYRNRKVSNGPLLLVGSNVYSDPMAKTSIRSAFDAGIVTNFDAMESVLDYVFTMLGCSDDHVEQPVVMTEPICTPYTARKHMSELLFECYGVKRVAYGVDAAWSYYKNMGSFDIDGMIVASGNTASHVIPVYDARIRTEQCRRINLGGLSMDDYMLKLLQLKYPSFPMKISEWQSHQLVEKFAYVAQDYDSELSNYLDTSNLQTNDVVVQFPFPMPVLDERTEEDIQRATERRREQAKKMQEMAAKKRQEKADQRINELEQLTALRDSKPQMGTDEYAIALQNAGLATEQDLDQAIVSAQQFVARAQNKDVVDEKETPSFPLVSVPDDQLNDEQRQEKRKQVFLKASHDARERARQEKERERLRMEEAMRIDDELRTGNFGQWLEELQNKRNAVVERMEERRARRRELNDRRSHASQMRMRNIADLAANEAGGNNSNNKRRRRGDQDDDFGAEDDDWNVYRDISKEDDDEKDEEDEAELEKYNRQLELHAPDYLESLDRKARSLIEATTMYRFAEGCQPAILEKPAAPYKPDNSAIVARAAREYQLHLNIERIRVPEMIFRPSLVGVDQAGLLETLDSVVRQTKRTELVKNVFVTGGGFAQMPGILDRLRRDIVSVVPAGTSVVVRRAADPLRDAWRGAALWCSKEPDAFSAGCISREDYLEMGAEYLREHGASNRYHKFPAAGSPAASQ
ncbi:Nuclear actin-protein involved in chromatin remodeling [Coemansia sp. RSA 1722]|nr:Nuclear actin-protein involved in chromatin remodeling [Coemansia sp. RSA 1722]KAJ2603069.1 Nuclear actin-protein involved in chromatin remodeling [Coemansia sp. RSA 1721]KAJ2640415.1 Nuclear actin-protein involved in chromatin remodeling [Coemansia sp. RSA 1286]